MGHHLLHPHGIRMATVRPARLGGREGFTRERGGIRAMLLYSSQRRRAMVMLAERLSWPRDWLETVASRLYTACADIVEDGFSLAWLRQNKS